MKAKSIMFILAMLLAVKTAFPAEQNTNTAAIGPTSTPASTNQFVKLKGVLSRTEVVRPDEATVKKLKAIGSKMEIRRAPDSKKRGPQTMQEAADYLAQSVNMVGPPALCLEHDGVFFFSGGKSTTRETNFLSGFAIKKGDTTILTWDEKTRIKKP